MRTSAHAKAHPGVMARIVGRALINRWVLPRVSQPDMFTALMHIAEQSGRIAQFWQITEGVDPRLAADGFRSNGPLPAGDYVSPGLIRVQPDACFPDMTIGDKATINWDYFRQNSPHNLYVDRRIPHVGFVNRDEAHILFNTALQASGKAALEIGCLLGWSSCHLALAGVHLDIVDPRLKNREAVTSVAKSLTVAGVMDRCRFIPDFSPAAVETLAKSEGKRWSLIFIDGNHSAPAPLIDAEACAQFAAEDCIVIFHDLLSPAVADGLRSFKTKGWQVRLYNTAQVVGVAWRGAMRPIDHIPDPMLGSDLPRHLADLM